MECHVGWAADVVVAGGTWQHGQWGPVVCSRDTCMMLGAGVVNVDIGSGPWEGVLGCDWVCSVLA